MSGALRNFRPQVRETGRVTVNVPVTSGNYAVERLTFGRVPSGEREQYIQKVTGLVESIVAGATVELWVCPMADGGHAGSDYTDSDFVNSGLTAPTAAGLTVWDLGIWSAVQIRVKSGGTGGAMTISGACY